MIDGKTNLLNEEEIVQLKNALELKRDIISYLNMESFIDKTRDIIDNSETFEFRNSSSRLYIDKRQPVFVLKLKDENTLREMVKRKDARDEVAKLLQIEIIQNISRLLTDCIKDDKSDLFSGIPAEIKEFVISNIYVIRCNIQENNIQLFFFV